MSSHPAKAPPRQFVSRLVPHNCNVLAVLLLFVSLVQAVTNGYDASMMNGLNILPSYTDYFSLTTASLSLNTASIWIGGMFAAFWAGALTDIVGRKWSMFIGAAISIVGIVLQSAAQNIAMFITGRILIGIAAGVSGVGKFALGKWSN